MVVEAAGGGPRVGSRGLDGTPVEVGSGDNGKEQPKREEGHEEEADVTLELVAEEIGAAGRETGDVRRIGEPAKIDNDLPVVGGDEALQIAVAAEKDAEAGDGLDVSHREDDLEEVIGKPIDPLPIGEPHHRVTTRSQALPPNNHK